MNDVLEPSNNGLSTGARDELRLRVLRALEANPELSQRQLAAELGVSLGGVNYALKALIERLYSSRRAHNSSRRTHNNAFIPPV